MKYKFFFAHFVFFFLLFDSFLGVNDLIAQRDFYKHHEFNKADTLRGQLNPFRTCYDVYFYHLNIAIDHNKRSIEGYNEIHFVAVENFTKVQVDLFSNMQLNKVVYKGKELKFEREHDAVFIEFPQIEKGTKTSFKVYYEGKPITAINPPWDGGFVWTEDGAGDPWVGVACEGDGASLWWPNKDHLSDEPDSMLISVAVSNPLQCIANGNLRSKKAIDEDHTQYNWFVSYPINNYNVTVNIANYAHFQETYEAGDGAELDLDYYVLKENLAKAKKHFRQVPKVLACFERYFGKYPFWNDGFALVETPYLGMEHQSAIAYGNQYKRGYMGGMIPRSMNWDYIIVHETGHEYWGNSISINDMSEMWIHESFTTYMEALFVECAYSYEEAVQYLGSQRMFIKNQEPIRGPMHVNWEDWDGSDHYFKGAWMLHTLRHSINDDEVWFDILKSFYDKHNISNVNTEDFINYVNTCTKKDYTAFFEQYLWHPNVPKLLYKTKKKGGSTLLEYKWEVDVKDFNMPILVGKKDKYQMIHPTSEWQKTTIQKVSLDEFQIARELFLIDLEKVK